MAERTRERWTTVVDAVAAAGVGTAFVYWGMTILPLILTTRSPFERSTLPDVTTLYPATAALIGTLVVMLGSRLRLPGWAIAAVGIVLAGLALDRSVLKQFDIPPMEVIYFAIAVAAGLMLAGIALAVAAASTTGRLAIATGFAVGMAVNVFLLQLLEAEPGQPMARFGPPQLILMPAAAAAIVATVLVLASGRWNAVRVGSDSRVIAPVASIAVAGVVVYAGFAIHAAVIDELRASPDSLASPRPNETVQAFDHYSLVALAVIVAVLLTWVAYRRGGTDLARWAALGFALAGPLLVVTRLTTRIDSPLIFLCLAAAGALAGALLAARVGNVAPWDAIGVLVAAAGAGIGTPIGPEQAEWVFQARTTLLTTGIGFALAAGFVRFCMTSAQRDAAWLAASVVFAPAAMLLVGQLLAPVVLLPHMGYGHERPLTTPVIASIGAATTLVLFLINRANLSRRQFPAA